MSQVIAASHKSPEVPLYIYTYTASQKFCDFWFNRFSFILMTAYIVDYHLRHQNYELTHMEYVFNKKVTNKP